MRVIAIKECVLDLCPWADIAYGCDAAWWKHRRGLPDFKGLKLAWEKDIPTCHPDVRLIRIKPSPRPCIAGNEWIDEILTDEIGLIGSGRNSAFQALNLAIQFGCKRVLMIGLDLHDRSGVHYYGRNNWFKAGNPDDTQFKRCIIAYNKNAEKIRSLGVDVVNASAISDLHCFHRASIEQTLIEWSL